MLTPPIDDAAVPLNFTAALNNAGIDALNAVAASHL